jgi:gamma-glutamylcyclotransferase (GGCT)/AIG2-like uncharacterized protein YtfP
MNSYLFVYGSLMSTAGHRMGARLHGEARRIGAASMQGRLYRVSWYPGAVDSTDPAHRVHGEVWALDDPERGLAWLDDYEGIAPGRGASGEYQRLERLVCLATGTEVAAWVYLYQGDVMRLPVISDGRWRVARA